MFLDECPESPGTLTARLMCWAAAILGVDLMTDAKQQREYVFERLQDAEFSPPHVWHEAIDALFDPPVEFCWDDWPGFQQDVFTRLSGEVDAFALTFFEMPFVERQLAWRSLSQRCEPFPILHQRLIALLPGLELDRETMVLSEGALTELGRLAVRLTVMPPLERILARFTAIEAMQSEPAKWESAAKLIQVNSPSVCALAPELFDEVSRFSEIRAAAELTRRNRRKRTTKFRGWLNREFNWRHALAVL